MFPNTSRLRLTCLAVATTTAVALTACGGTTRSSGPGGATGAADWPDTVAASGVGVVPVLVSADVAVGRQRFLLSLLDDGEPAADPETKVDVAFYDLVRSRTKPATSARARFFWALEGERGLYSVPVDFTRAGKWGVAVTVRRPGRKAATSRLRFDVSEKSRTPALGAPAPRTPTKTAADVGGNLAAISTDATPDPAFYALSIPQALDAHRPFVVVFATPKLCTSKVCAPTLDLVKRLARDFPGVSFLHVEIYENLDAPEPTGVPAVEGWSLPSEPWIFLVDSDGEVADKFEGSADPAELQGALAKLR